MKTLTTLFALTVLLISGNLSAQTCNQILGVWEIANTYREFRSDGGIYLLPADEISGRWECSNSATGDFTINWNDQPLNYKIASDGKTFTNDDGKFTWTKVNGEVGKIWWANSNGSIPTNAIRKGNFPICKCEYDGYTYPGNYVDGACQILVDNQSQSNKNCEILVRSKGIEVDWVQSDGWNTPPGLITGGRSARMVFNIGAVERNGKIYPGAASFPGGIKAYVNVNGEAVVDKDFLWLSTRIVPIAESKEESTGVDLMGAQPKKSEKKEVLGTGGN